MLQLVPMPADAATAPGALRDHVVLVTGAAGGLGSATALACAAAGATVVLLGRKVKPLEQLYDRIVAAGGPQPAIYPLNLEGATPKDYTELAQAIERECGRLDGIVHAAAHFEGLMALSQVLPEDWVRSTHVNLSAPVLLTQACLPLLSRAPSASVVLVLDDPARIERAYWGAYAAAKAGLTGVLHFLADELENTPVRVRALLPGPMRTALRARAYFGEDPASVSAPELFAPACVYLIDPACEAPRGAVLDARGLALARPAAG